MLKINKKDIAIIANCIGLPFLPSVPGAGRVCFAANSEVRPEFLESFNEKHIEAYISGYLKFTEKQETVVLKIPFPTDAVSFWDTVKKGSDKDSTHFEESESSVVFFGNE